MIAGMCGLSVGAYGLLNGSGARSLGFPALIGGSVLCALGLALGGRRVSRTQYRPDPWRLPEWLVSATGVVPAAVFLVGFGTMASALYPSTTPIAWPGLPLLPAAAILVAALAGFAAPPPRTTRPAAGPPPARRQREDDAATPAGAPVAAAAPTTETTETTADAARAEVTA
jgi:energy-coupling factor transport system permease protein